MKKFLLVYVSSIALVFAGVSEITPVVGGVHSFGSDKFSDHVTVGIRVGTAVDNFLIDQVELGYDYSRGVKYKGIEEKADFNRLYLNAIKDLKFRLPNNIKLYGLVGLGHEDVSKITSIDVKSGPFAQYGAGIKYDFGDFSLRGEVRHSIKFNSGNGNVFYTLGFAIPIGTQDKAPAPVIEEIVVKDDPIPTTIEQEEEFSEAERAVLRVLELSTDNKKRYFNFEFDKAQIMVSDDDVAKAIAEDLAQYGDSIRVRSEGYTDSKGSRWYNLKLSQKRAEAVKNALIKNGIKPEDIETVGYGKGVPLKTNSTEEGRAANRRAEVIFIAPVAYFEFNSANLLEEGEKIVKLVANNLISYDDIKVIVEGHTDSKGSKWYNLKLSQKRAETVKDRLVKNGIAASRIEVKGYGKDKPLKVNNTEEGRAINRRVDIIFVNPNR